jgi:hypothetical protein
METSYCGFDQGLYEVMNQILLTCKVCRDEQIFFFLQFETAIRIYIQ